MSARGWGARTTYGQKVILNIYDLSPVNDALEPFGLGVYHSGVQIGNREYTFAGGSGVFDHSPQEAPTAKFRCGVEIGMFEGGQPAVNQALEALRPKFGPDSYNLMSQNCNHFSDAMCRQLLSKPIPGYVNRMAILGACCASCLPPEMLQNSPVGGNSGGGGANSSPGFQMMGGGSRRLANGPAAPPAPVFGGSGQTLGSGSSATSNSGGGSSNELNDRRERIRAATLARMSREES